jgi:hypothetical protein
MTASFGSWLSGVVGVGCAGALLACSAGDAQREEGTGATAPSVSGNPYSGATTTTGTPAANNGAAGTSNGSTGTNTETGPNPTQVTPGTGTGATGSNTTGTGSTGTGSTTADTGLGNAQMGGTGQSSDRYQKADVTRDGKNYFFMSNGWGPGFQSQSVSWNGTSFTVTSMQGTQGPNYQPASYPTVFCGQYSDSVSKECGLPAALDSMTGLQTGWSWNPNGNSGQYDAAYDIWLGTGSTISTHSGFFMVWYRDPPGQQPAGQRTMQGLTVANVPGTWDVWTGAVGGLPIINYVRPEGQDTTSLAFNILDFIKDAKQRGMTIPGDHVLSVAVGFEIWKGPVTNLESSDFFVDVQH